MRLYERIALYLWRDRGGYDPGTGGMSKDYNRSLITRFRHWRYERRGWLGRSAPWLLPALIGAGATVGVVFLTKYLDGTKPDQQMKTNAGELLLRCTQEADGVLRCIKTVEAQHQIITSSNGDRLNNRGPRD